MKPISMKPYLEAFIGSVDVFSLEGQPRKESDAGERYVQCIFKANRIWVFPLFS